MDALPDLETTLKNIFRGYDVPKAVGKWLREKGCTRLLAFANLVDKIEDVKEATAVPAGVGDGIRDVAATRMAWRAANVQLEEQTRNPDKVTDPGAPLPLQSLSMLGLDVRDRYSRILRHYERTPPPSVLWAVSAARSSVAR